MRTPARTRVSGSHLSAQGRRASRTACGPLCWWIRLTLHSSRPRCRVRWRRTRRTPPRSSTATRSCSNRGWAPPCRLRAHTTLRPWRGSTRRARRRSLRSFLLGFAFAAAWTPCIGIVLGSILALAATSSDPLGATALLLSYSAGLGLPFILIAVVAARSDDRTSRILSSLRRGTRTAGRLGGVLVALIGVAIAAGLLPLLARYLPGLPGL